MIDLTKITTIAEQELEGTDMFVVSCTATPSNEIELLIDSDTNVSIENCIKLSRAIEGQFDRELEDFALMVASAGIGSELKFPRQYQKMIDKSVEVLLKDGIKIVAKLTKFDEQGLTLSYTERQAVEGKKRKQEVDVVKEYGFDQIKYTKEFLDYK